MKQDHELRESVSTDESRFSYERADQDEWLPVGSAGWIYDPEPPEPPLPPADPAPVAATRPSRAEVRRAARGRSDALRRGLYLGAMVIAALLSMTIVAGSGFAWYEWKGLNDQVTIVHAITGGPTGSNGQPAADVDGTDQNILIVGNDDRDTATAEEKKQLVIGDDHGSYNTDTMMILHAPADGRSAAIISLPRDTWVDIPGHGMGKLNSAYPDGVNSSGGDKSAGARLMVQTVQNLTGLTIDHYVQVDLIGFYRISNALDGIPVNLCKAVNDPYSGINLPAGWNKIKGVQALAFVRQRHNLGDGTDLRGRIQRQQYFLTAAFKAMKSSLLNPITLNKLINAVASSVSIDDPSFLPKLASQFSNLDPAAIDTETIPILGTPTIDGINRVQVDPSQIQSWIKLVVNPPKATPTPVPTAQPSTVPPGSFTVDVLNGSGTSGMATTNSDALAKLGFKTGTVDTAPQTVNSTLVEYPLGMSAQADTLASVIPGATTKATSSVTKVTLLLGSDGAAVNGVATPTPSSSAPSPTVTVNPAATGACIN